MFSSSEIVCCNLSLNNLWLGTVIERHLAYGFYSRTIIKMDTFRWTTVMEVCLIIYSWQQAWIYTVSSM